MQFVLIFLVAIFAISLADDEPPTAVAAAAGDSSDSVADGPPAAATAGNSSASVEVPEEASKKLQACCDDLNAEAKLDCAKLAANDPSAISNIVPEVFQYYFKCVAHSKNNTKCCKQKSIPENCLSICDASSPPTSEQLIIECIDHLPKALSPCAVDNKERFNLKDAANWLKNPKNQQKIANGIATGIKVANAANAAYNAYKKPGK